MIYLYLTFTAGYLLCFLVMRREVKRLKFSNDALLDFNEKCLRQIEVDEQQLQGANEKISVYCEHLETHECRYVGLADDTPIFEGDEVGI